MGGAGVDLGKVPMTMVISSPSLVERPMHGRQEVFKKWELPDQNKTKLSNPKSMLQRTPSKGLWSYGCSSLQGLVELQFNAQLCQ